MTGLCYWLPRAWAMGMLVLLPVNDRLVHTCRWLTLIIGEAGWKLKRHEHSWIITPTLRWIWGMLLHPLAHNFNCSVGLCNAMSLVLYKFWPKTAGLRNMCLLRTRIKQLLKLTDNDGDVYCGTEFNDVDICIIVLVCYTLLKLKEKNPWHFVSEIPAFALH